jgi:signal transduction histidine kinase
MKDLFALARPAGIEKPDPVRIADRLDSALFGLASYPGMETVEVVRDYAPDLPEIRADGRRLEHAFQNLMANAVEAMSSGGTLTLRARRSADGGVDLEFADTGTGMPEETVAYALKPFYSTKPHGTGLGLPLVTRVISAHLGTIGIDSQPGAGTTVRIHLPPGTTPGNGA